MHVIKRFADQTDKKEKTDREDGDRYRKKERKLRGKKEKDRTGRETCRICEERTVTGRRETGQVNRP